MKNYLLNKNRKKFNYLEIENKHNRIRFTIDRAITRQNQHL